MGADTLAYGTLIGGVLLVSGWNPRLDESARQLVLRSMEGRFSFNVVAVVEQKSKNGSGLQTVKLFRDKQGRVSKYILGSDGQPDSRCVDDGQRVFFTFSDSKFIFEQDSDRASGVRCQSSRAHLADQNYDFRFVSNQVVAGRKAVRIEAYPRVAGKSSRVYVIDVKTGYPLGLEVKGREGQQRNLMLTKQIQFPKELPNSFFQIRSNTQNNSQFVRCSSLKAVRTPEQVRSSLGFTPILPPQIPMGFAVEEMQVCNSSDWKRCTLRLSDGLVKATVYQWRNDHSKPKFGNMHGYTLDEANGIRLMVVSDANATVRRRILDAFMRASDQLNLQDSWLADSFFRNRTSEAWVFGDRRQSS